MTNLMIIFPNKIFDVISNIEPRLPPPQTQHTSPPPPSILISVRVVCRQAQKDWFTQIYIICDTE